MTGRKRSRPTGWRVERPLDGSPGSPRGGRRVWAISHPEDGGTAAERRGAAIAERKRQAAEWEKANPEPTDPELFRREILPLIQGVPLRRLVDATGLSLRYCSLIRRGEKVPHPRHWAMLREANSGH
jgi:hypothetical protein